jgi:hypothetical protein
MSLGSGLLAAGFVFFVSDLVYVLDHYFVHHDRERYVRTHGRHHRRYNGPKTGPHLDPAERATYNSAGLASGVGASVLTLYTGNPGFMVGALLKWAHSLLFHLYQHRWWGSVPIGKQGVPRPRARWGLATARYHAYHHTQPNDARFTYAESWAGFDRLLELAHPWLVGLTADGRRARREGRAAAPRTLLAEDPSEGRGA